MNAPTTTPGPTPRPPRRWRRALRWLGLGLGGLVVLLALALWWLLGSESGARFVLARAAGATAGRLTLESSRGPLAGPLTITGLRWHDAQAGVDAQVRELRIDPALLALLRGRVRIATLEAGGIDVALDSVPPQPAPPAPEPATPFSLTPPIALALDRLALRDARLTRDGEPVFAFDSLDAAAAWTRSELMLRSLALRAAAGRVDLDGTLANTPGHPGTGTLSFDWQLGGARYAGDLAAHGDGRRATLALALSAPTPARLEATLGQEAKLPWTVKLDLPRFDPRLVQADAPLQAAALSLAGSGDRDAGTLQGAATVNDHEVRIDPLHWTRDGNTLQLAPLKLTAADAVASLTASGRIELGAQPPSAELTLDWHGVELPPDLVGQKLASHGQLALRGSAQAYHVAGAFALGPPGHLADIALELDGTPTAITLRELALKQPQGGLDARGTLQLTPALGWDLTATATRLDPGAFLAAWPGAVDFALATHGSAGSAGIDATAQLERLGGTLRGKALHGSGQLRLQGSSRVEGKLALAAGSSRVDFDGSLGPGGDASLRFAVGALGDWLADARGALDGRFRIRGQWPALAIEGTAQARGIAHGDAALEALTLSADVTQLEPPQGSLTLAASGLASGTLRFDTLSVQGRGERSRHELAVSARGEPLGFTLALDGVIDAANAWHATLRTLDLAIAQAPPLTLQQPATLSVGRDRYALGELCLGHADTRLCAAADGGTDGSLAARWRIAALPLALVAGLAGDLPIRLDGAIEGGGELQRNSKGALSGNAQLASPQGSIAARERGDDAVLHYGDLALEATLAPQATQLGLRAALGHGGRLDGKLDLGGAFGTPQTLAGNLDLTLDDLAFIDAFTDQLAATRGRLAAHYTLAGSTAAPQVTGALTLGDFATEVPAAGLKLHDGQIELRASDAEHFVLSGSLASGSGTLMLAGSGGVTPDAPFTATLKGRDFLAADIPAAHVAISPDLVITREDTALRIGGGITIPSAAIDLAKLPGGGANQASPDVVIVDAEAVPAARPLPLLVDVGITLGDDVKLAGFGLDGSVSGQLAIRQRPGRAPVGTGTINAQGTYKAYGQNLVIENGRVLFAGSPLDNPGLDIRAVRKIAGPSGGQFDDGIVAGLQVRGTALLPVLTVFSRPVMEQSEALSYLLTGKPLSSLKSGEGDMLGTAARALGSATGDLLAKGIGARLGVDAGVADNGALGGAAFTVGKYLSPKLYLGYGVGLFTPGQVVSLKYYFSRRWNFEAQNATTGSRAGINYRHER